MDFVGVPGRQLRDIKETHVESKIC